MIRILFLALALPAVGAAADAENGKRVVLAPGEAGCASCHEIPGADAPAASAAPSLAGVGARLSVDVLFWWIVDASRFTPDTTMPRYGRIEGAAEPRLSTAEIQDAAAFLATLK